MLYKKKLLLSIVVLMLSKIFVIVNIDNNNRDVF